MQSRFVEDLVPPRTSSTRRQSARISSLPSYSETPIAGPAKGKQKDQQQRSISGATTLVDESGVARPVITPTVSVEVPPITDELLARALGKPSVVSVTAKTTKSISKKPTLIQRAKSWASTQKTKVLGKRKSSRLAELDEEPPLKKTRLQGSIVNPVVDAPAVPTPSAAVSAKKKLSAKDKRYLRQGLYVGQTPDFDPRFNEFKNKSKHASKGSDAAKINSILPPPMFAGKRLLENGRDFKLPFNVFSPLTDRQPKPDEWRKTRRNVFIGDAGELWKNSKRLEHSLCMCEEESGCDEHCLNRTMFYECDERNCNIGKEHCTNRAFEELRKRTKKGGKFDIGVEVIKTADRGYGVRSNRTFEPGQIIVEYTGEIITQEESDKRMHTIYKDNECFYLMMFDQNMIIDATRGSITRFVNHSCSPNCAMVKWIVDSKPRMALFAGERGIMTGEELTYDYNFDPFSTKNIQECRCGSDNCRGVLGPKQPKDRELKDALEPLTGKTGVKQKLQEMVTDAIDKLSNKRPKLPLPSGLAKKRTGDAVVKQDAYLAKAHALDRAARIAQRNGNVKSRTRQFVAKLSSKKSVSMAVGKKGNMKIVKPEVKAKSTARRPRAATRNK